MKNFITLSILYFFITQSTLTAQGFSGIATYQSSAGIKINLGEKASEVEQERIQNEISKKFQKEHELHFTSSESTWKKIESLEATPNVKGNSSMEFLMMSSGKGGILYKNIGEKRYEREEDLVGKSFIIKDSLPNYDWQLTNETKKIGSYNCQKAIYTKVVETKNFSTDMEEMETGTDTLRTEAWFTMDIPVSNGPNDYYGLPGLILEVKTGTMVVICTKIVLNPEQGVKIEQPKKGKVMDSETFKALSEEKMKEMMKRYSGDGESIRIEIGG